MQDEELNVVVGVMRTANLLASDLKNNIKGYNINTTEFSVLEFLYHKGEKTIQQIRERILVASGSTTYVVDNLEKKGYVTRKPCEDDKRIYYVNLTPQGKELIMKIFPKHKENTKKLFQNFKKEEVVQLKNLLKKFQTD